MAELKPCPFCGGEARMQTWRIEWRRANPTTIHCAECRAKTNIYQRKKEAIEAWNRRVEDGNKV